MVSGGGGVSVVSRIILVSVLMMPHGASLVFDLANLANSANAANLANAANSANRANTAQRVLNVS